MKSHDVTMTHNRTTIGSIDCDASNKSNLSKHSSGHLEFCCYNFILEYVVKMIDNDIEKVI